MPDTWDAIAEAYRRNPSAFARGEIIGSGGAVPGDKAFTGNAKAGGAGMPGPLAIGSAAASALGGALTAGSQSAAEKRRHREQSREFNVGNARDFELGSRSAALNEGQFANQLGLQNASAPLRDRAAYALLARMGLPTEAFVGRDILNPQNGSPQRGGIDFNAFNQANAAYTPGAGGQMNTSLQQAILGQLGYAQGAGGQYSASRQPFNAQTEIDMLGADANTFIQSLAKQGRWEALQAIAAGQGPSSTPGGPTNYGPEHQALARQLLQQSGQQLNQTTQASIDQAAQQKARQDAVMRRLLGSGGVFG